MRVLKREAPRSRRVRQVVGVAWYSEIEWARLKEAANDPEILEDTYGEWCRVYADAVEKLEKAGATCIPVPLLISEVSDWCAKKGRPLDASARAEFVANRVRLSGGSPVNVPGT